MSQVVQPVLRRAYDPLFNGPTLRTIARPAFDYDFLYRQSVGSATFGRALSAYYTDSDGVLASFSSGAARIGDRGLLVEEQRVNVCTYASDFSNASWTLTGATISADAEDAPDGTTTADSLVEDTNTSAHRCFHQVTPTAGTAVWGAIVKAAGRDRVAMETNGASNATSFFLLTGAGSVVAKSANHATATIAALTDGWYLCAVSYTALAAAHNNVIYAVNTGTTQTYLGDGTAALHLWNAQSELGSQVSSAIPTTSAGVTRPADVVTPQVPDGDYDILVVREGGSDSWITAQTISSSDWTVPVDMDDPYVERVIMAPVGTWSASDRAALGAR